MGREKGEDCNEECTISSLQLTTILYSCPAPQLWTRGRIPLLFPFLPLPLSLPLSLLSPFSPPRLPLLSLPSLLLINTSCARREGKLPPDSPHGGVCPGLQQHLHAVLSPGRHGAVESRAEVLVVGIHVSPVVHEQLGHLVVVVGDRQHQGSPGEEGALV